MSPKDMQGLIAIALMLGLIAAIAWYLVSVTRVAWFRERLLSPERGKQIIGIMPIAVPVYLFFMIVIRPHFK